jgi:hypothetical protein
MTKYMQGLGRPRAMCNWHFQVDCGATPGQMCFKYAKFRIERVNPLSDWLTQITVLSIERENQGTAIKGKLTTLMDTGNNKIINHNLQGA